MCRHGGSPNGEACRACQRDIIWQLRHENTKLQEELDYVRNRVKINKTRIEHTDMLNRLRWVDTVFGYLIRHMEDLNLVVYLESERERLKEYLK
jgi:hypothetical protein